ncbi:2,3-diaminopropionate biosynthesis protein SbnB [Actinoplanes sp. NPDC051851]|uniref:2,3-diaminopropionate biosynthesis protein SbnB n=1 Tax=Actinoplanes sp. NPDC051851 TaxID=3154753 RepID=UPI00342F9BA8
MLVISHGEVMSVLADRDTDIVDTVAEAYRSHFSGASALPYSVFLRFPGNDRNRIIGLPGFLDGKSETAGIKWIASFPGNVERGIPRASALIVLNDTETGRPTAVIEGSAISARRTGAGAALAARLLPRAETPDTSVALIGCGVINVEVLRFLRRTVPGLAVVTLFDTDRGRAEECGRRVGRAWPDLRVQVAADIRAAMAGESLLSIATTAVEPHLDLRDVEPGALVLHVSLRDLTADAILRADNVVDDVGHVCREQTSVHRAQQRVGHTNFIRDTIGGLLERPDPVPRLADRVTVFSPFGLGVLDLAVARFVHARAVENGLGLAVDGFLP